jgi:outer membrane protein
LEAQGDKLSDTERASRTRILEDKKKHAQRLAEDSQSGFQGEMQELYNGTASKVYEVLASYAQQQGLSLVLDVSQEQNPVLYALATTNITKQITEAYNVKSGVPAPPAAKAPAAR